MTTPPTVTVTEKSPIDAAGNITLNVNAGFSINLAFQDATGAAIDVSERPIYFVISKRLRKALTPGPTPATCVFDLTDIELQRLSTAGTSFNFVFRDESYVDPSGATCSQAFWSGTLTLVGT